MPKNKKRPGRKRIAGIPRVSHNGRASRSKVAIHKRLVESAKEAREVAVTARLAKHKEVKNFTEELASDDKRSGYELGLLHIAEKITTAELRAGNRFCEDAERFYRLSGTPFPSARAQDITGARGRSLLEADPEKVEAAKNRWAGLQGCIAIYDKPQGKPIWTTLVNLCVLNHSTANWPPHMETLIHKGLGALIGFYGIEAQDVDSESKAA